MLAPFRKIALMARQITPGITDTLCALNTFLHSQGLCVFVESKTAAVHSMKNDAILESSELAKHCDLIIAVGGDGSLLHAANAVVDQTIPLLGVNRGRLGFLTDIYPAELHTKIAEILEGHYESEERFLLSAAIGDKKDHALNDVVLTPIKPVHMLEFEIEIDGEFMCQQRADGLIISTPTGSTAYCLSAGGPILHPALDAMVLVPMFPHTLSSRPIVIEGNCKIALRLSEDNKINAGVSCDGRERFELSPEDTLTIQKKRKKITLIHPRDYRYFETLRSKLKWENKC